MTGYYHSTAKPIQISHINSIPLCPFSKIIKSTKRYFNIYLPPPPPPHSTCHEALALL